MRDERGAMGKQEASGRVRVHFNVPAPLWEKACVAARLSPSLGNASAVADLAAASFAKVTRSLSADGFADVARPRKDGEALLPAVVFLSPAAEEAASGEAARLGTSRSLYLTTALAAMLSEINPMLYSAIKEDFARTVRKWRDEDGEGARAVRLTSGEPAVKHGTR